MTNDERYVAAIKKIMNEHKLQGSEAPAFVMILKWLEKLPERLSELEVKDGN